MRIWFALSQLLGLRSFANQMAPLMRHLGRLVSLRSHVVRIDAVERAPFRDCKYCLSEGQGLRVVSEPGDI